MPPYQNTLYVLFDQDTNERRRLSHLHASTAIHLDPHHAPPFAIFSLHWWQQVREFGANVPKGTLYSINPAIIIILVPIVTAMTSHVEPLVMIHYGSYVSAASVFVLAFSTSLWACVVFVTVLSLGEAIWSPRLYDYTVSVCPEGREGTFMALSSAPLFLAKLPVGFLSGYLLQKYCPETLEEGEERHSQTMWLIIGLLTASSPVLMTCCWNYVSKKDSVSLATEFHDSINYTELQPTNSRSTTID